MAIYRVQNGINHTQQSILHSALHDLKITTNDKELDSLVATGTLPYLMVDGALGKLRTCTINDDGSSYTLNLLNILRGNLCSCPELAELSVDFRHNRLPTDGTELQQILYFSFGSLTPRRSLRGIGPRPFIEDITAFTHPIELFRSVPPYQIPVDPITPIVTPKILRLSNVSLPKANFAALLNTFTPCIEKLKLCNCEIIAEQDLFIKYEDMISWSWLLAGLVRKCMVLMKVVVGELTVGKISEGMTYDLFGQSFVNSEMLTWVMVKPGLWEVMEGLVVGDDMPIGETWVLMIAGSTGNA